jgi:hypothetical protein
MRRTLVSTIVILALALPATPAPATEDDAPRALGGFWSDFVQVVQRLLDRTGSSTAEEGPLIDPNGGAATSPSGGEGGSASRTEPTGDEGPLIDPNG